MKVIELSSVTKVYPNKVAALKNLNLSVKKGCITGFIGVNGAGKSTTINIISGLLLANSGSVKIFGKELKKGDWRYKKNIGFVLEKPPYLEYLTGREFLDFVSLMYDMREDIADNRINELLDFFELTKKPKELIKTYSRGMRKKISLAAAILPRPELLVLDEPLEGLDPLSANNTKKMLSDFAEEGGTVFFSSHELGTVENICDNIIIINEGQSVYQGTVNDLRSKHNLVENELASKSLEELFVKLVGEDKEEKKLSWF